MLDFSRRSLGAIVRDVFVDRGGAPAQFLVEHVTLSWPGGVEGLRLPSLFFFLLSLPVAAAVGRRLLGETAGLLLPPLLALAPLAVELATFGRMYALFLLCVLGATWLGIRAAASGSPRAWAVAGAAAGLLVYVHPIAPLYAPLALLTGLAVRPQPWRAPRQRSASCAPRSSPERSRRCRTRTHSRCSDRATTSARRPVSARRPDVPSRRRACTRSRRAEPPVPCSARCSQSRGSSGSHGTGVRSRSRSARGSSCRSPSSRSSPRRRGSSAATSFPRCRCCCCSS